MFRNPDGQLVRLKKTSLSETTTLVLSFFNYYSKNCAQIKSYFRYAIISEVLYSVCVQGLEPAPLPPALPPPPTRPQQVIMCARLDVQRAQTKAFTALEPFHAPNAGVVSLKPLYSIIPGLSGVFLSLRETRRLLIFSNKPLKPLRTCCI